MTSFAVIGLSTMGGNLARNAARRGIPVAVHNRTVSRTEEFLKDHGSEGTFIRCDDYAQLKTALTAPRAVLIMVKAGPAVDQVIADILPHLEPGDILIDGGNSLYTDTARRAAALKEKGMLFLGMGVSGGEEGALKGPSMMPGGDKAAWEQLKTIVTALAADDGEGGKCVGYMGPGGAGHFVKMVHNGIEYGIMQLIAESYDLLKNVGGLSNKELGDTFKLWNQGEDLKSFLIEITGQVFDKTDPDSGGLLLDVIRDAAGQKGTGKWTTDAAMGYGVAVPTITAAVDARIISGDRAGRPVRNAEFPTQLGDAYDKPQELLAFTRTALGLSIICSYLQGFDLLAAASKAENWNLDLSEISRVWRGGCIIRSELLKQFQWLYGADPVRVASAKQTLFGRFAGQPQADWRRTVQIGIQRGIPLPAMTASLAWFDAYRSPKLPQNLIQAQRDLFGAHTYERLDKPGVFHSEWSA
jgi:6-phosphogluconate dehydrogenase